MFITTLFPQLLGSSSCPDGLWFEPSTGLCAPPDEVLLSFFLPKDCSLFRSAALSLMRIPAADEEVEFELNICLLLVFIVSKVNLVKSLI